MIGSSNIVGVRRSDVICGNGTAVFPAEGLADTSLTWNVDFFAGDGLRVNFTDSKKNKQGCRFEGDKGWVHVNRGSLSAEPKSLLGVSIGPDEEQANRMLKRSMRSPWRL